MNGIGEDTYPDMMRKFRNRRNESEVLLPLMSQFGLTFGALKNIQSCLSIGPGPGEFDLEFMKRCLPGLKKLVAVEKDHHCAEEFRTNISKVKNGSLECEVIETDVNNFQPVVNQKFEVVLAIQMLYHFSSEERIKLFDNILNKWLDQDKGLFVVIIISGENDAKNRSINVVQNVCYYLTEYMEMLVDSDVIRDEVEKVGGEVVHSLKYMCSIDFTSFDEDITQLFNMYSKTLIDSETMKKAIEAAAPNGLAPYPVEILVIKKKHK